MLRGKAKYTVLCDFDGTVTNADIGFCIIQEFAGEGWLEIEAAYQRGEKGSRQALEEIFTLTRVTEEKLCTFIDKNFFLDPYFPQFLEFCRQHGLPVTVLSDGFDFYIKRLFAGAGLTVPYLANTLRLKGSTLQAGFPHYNAVCGDCGNCKRNFARQVKAEGRKIIYIGDGFSDRCASAEADILFAKGYLADYCDSRKMPYFRFDSFADVLQHLQSGAVMRSEEG
ncbi:MAG TPA: MtnX-like HAD-IB family phosphatase [Firmicutes bacterium]|nr:MtnX-like HAD-IB family phosphatase [Bacillota bacterium]